jgi:hypothetical protein
MNPFEFIKNFMTRGMTPKGIVQKIVGNNNPMFNNLIQMAEKGDNKGVETFARNVLKERGIDYDKEVENLKRTLNIH